MSKTEDDRNSAGKVLDLLDALSGYAVSGASNGALARMLELTPSTVTVLMKTVIGKGWARKDDATGHFHPTPQMGRVFGRVLADIDKAERQISDLKHNFTRNV